MRKLTGPLWILLFIALSMLLLTACVRPFPGSDASASESVPVPVATQPILVPQVPASTPEISEPATEPEPTEAALPTEAPLEPTAVPPSESIHTVQAGDTLFSIALNYNVTVDEIAAANNIVDIDSLEVGQQLVIPAPGSTIVADEEDVGQEDLSAAEVEAETGSETQVEPTQPAAAQDGIHVVQPGENLFRIGLQYGCTVEQLSQHNGITTPNRISVGQQIEIPDCS